MEVIVERPAALDVHKAQVTACVRVPGEDGERAEQVQQFKTTVPDSRTSTRRESDDERRAHDGDRGGRSDW